MFIFRSNWLNHSITQISKPARRLAGRAIIPARRLEKILATMLKKPKSMVHGMNPRISTLVKMEIGEKNSKFMSKIGKTAA